MLEFASAIAVIALILIIAGWYGAQRTSDTASALRALGVIFLGILILIVDSGFAFAVFLGSM